MNDEVLLSILGRGVADEYNRPTIANHTVVIPGALLRSGQLAFAEIEAAATEFDKRVPKAAGRIDPIAVHPHAPEEAREPIGSGIRRFITKAAVDTLASRFLADRGSRTLVLCRGSTNQYRNELLYRLVELSNAGGRSRSSPPSATPRP